MYIMLTELDSPFKINKFIYATDLFILVGFVLIGVLFQGLVYSNLQIVFFIFNLLVGCFCTARFNTNPQKRNIQSVLILLRRTSNKRTYHSLSVEYSSMDEMELR